MEKQFEIKKIGRRIKSMQRLRIIQIEKLELNCKM